MRALMFLAFLSLLAAPARAAEGEREVARSSDGKLVAVWINPYWRGRALEVRTPKGRVLTRIVHGIDSANWRVFTAAAVAVPVLGAFHPRSGCGPSPEHADGIAAAAFAPGGKRLAIAYEGRVRIFELPSGRRCGSAATPFFDSATMRFTDNGARVHVGGTHRYSHSSFVLDGVTGKPLEVERGHD